MLHNFILSVYVGDSQFNDITIHNKDLTQSGLSLWVSEIKLETKREGLSLGMEIWVYLISFSKSEKESWVNLSISNSEWERSNK